MPVFGNSNVSHVLSLALAFRELGCAVIPLVGGADHHLGKRPAIRWSVYQTRLPYPDELSAWFGPGGFMAYGVVCGPVSSLVVLDLDKPALAESFARQFPHLMETLVVTSGVRGTPHIYWRADFKVESRAFPGGDLKAQGGYVVGPGSSIAGAAWRVASDKPIRPITPGDLADVLAFLSPPVDARPSVAPPVGIPTPSRNGAARRGDLPVIPAPAPLDLPAFYARRRAAGTGRNKALFDTARLARDSGWTEAAALKALADVHIAAHPPADHPRESRAARAAEAARTVQSVYSRPPSAGTRDAPATRFHAPFDSSIPLLPNAARERLLARPDGAAILRAYEGALLSGVAAGALVTEPELCRLLDQVVSRKTIRKALAATYEDGQPVFEMAGLRRENPLPPQTPPTGVDTGVEKLLRQKNALLSAGHEGTKVAHRPARCYRMPAVAAICAGLGVKMSLSSPLTLADLSSSRGCRQALHADLLTRRPGVYSQNLLGARLGVTARTIRRYHRQMPVCASKTYEETPVSSATLRRIPSGAEVKRLMLNVGGQFLMDSAGDKWPLKREIAAWLLKRGRRVSHMRQGPSFYWMPEARVGIPTLPAREAAPPPTMPDALPPGCVPVSAAGQTILVKASAPRLCQQPLFAQEGGSTPRIAANGVITHQNAGIPVKSPNPRESRRKYHRPLPDERAERLASRLWATIEDFSLMNARRLVTTYGVEPVEAALKKMLWLQARGRISNPGGFMVTASRVSWRIQHRKTGLGDPAPRFRAEPRGRERASG